MSTTPYYDPTQYLDGSGTAASAPATPASSDTPAPLGGALNTFMADTAGVVYRAFAPSFGAPLVDPWTKAELVDQATASYIAAGMDPATAQMQAAADIQTAADTSPAANLSIGQVYAPYIQDFFNNLFKGDPTKPCGFFNIGACFPTWVIWVGGGLAVVAVLWVVRPYVVGAEELTGH